MTQQLTKDDLRGCPFCGGLGDIEQIESGCFGVGCQDCDFQLMNGTIGLGWHKSESDAIRAWNERNSDLCIQGLQDWTKKLQSSLDAANKHIAELEQGKCLHQIAEPAELGMDAQMLNFINDKRVALTPEYDGPWKAEVFADEAEPVITTEGNTVRDAVNAALAAQAKQGGA